MERVQRDGDALQKCNIIICEIHKCGESRRSSCERKKMLLVRCSCIMYINILVHASFCFSIHGAVISLICHKSVTTQNLAFLSYWYKKKRSQIHF